MRVTTNNHRRPVVDTYDDPEAGESRLAFMFRGEWQHVDEFSRLGYPFAPVPGTDSLADAGWQAARSDSAFDALVIRYVEDDCGDPAVIVGHVTW